MSGPPVVEVVGVEKRFARKGESVHALERVDLSVGPREFVSLVGPSGCGKSTLLNIAAGLIRPTGGHVMIKGRRVTGPLPEVGMMFQNPVLLPWRTARANVLLPIEVRGGRGVARASRRSADELLELVGLAGFEEKYPEELSGGMQQRVAICRMLVVDPEVLLMDEPFGALDEITREHMNVELARIFSAAARAAIFVTHNIQEAVFLSDRVYVMTSRPGKIAGVVEVDLPRPRDLELVTEERFQRLVRQARSLLDVGAGTPLVRQVSSGAVG